MHEQWRKSITTLAFLLVTAFATGAAAQAPKSPLALKPDAPDRYVVVPGDTLWSIAQRYSDSPWRWAELWNLNKDEIKNPHRIYPGNVIVLDRARGQLALDSSTLKLSPRMRAESTARAAIPSIPSTIIEPFLTRPLVVEADGLEKAPTIVASEESRVMLSTGSRAFVRGMGDSKEATWFLYRRGQALVDPDTKSTLGYEALYLGTAQVVRAGEPGVVILTTATRDVVIGDKLVAAGRPEVPSYAPRAPTTDVKGQIIALYGGTSKTNEAGGQSIVAINRGKSHGLEAGHVLALYRPGATVTPPKGSTAGQSALTLPDDRYGTAFVFRVFDKISYALVMHITRPAMVADMVQNP